MVYLICYAGQVAKHQIAENQIAEYITLGYQPGLEMASCSRLINGPQPSSFCRNFLQQASKNTFKGEKFQ